LDREAEAHFRRDLVALGDRDLTHVVAEAANFAPCQSCQARAARIQAPTRSCTSGSDQWPTTTLRGRRSARG
jgi:hypothetical protein